MSSDTCLAPILDHANKRWIRVYKWELDRVLPEPGHEWLELDVGLREAGLLSGARNHGVIYPVGEVIVHYNQKTGNPTTANTRYVYETNPDAYAWLERCIETATAILPCGHDGFENVRGEDGVRCKVPFCRERFDADEVGRR